MRASETCKYLPPSAMEDPQLYRREISPDEDGGGLSSRIYVGTPVLFGEILNVADVVMPVLNH